jgi:hypothetical protein
MSGMCSLVDVKTWLGLTDTTQDAKIQLFIDTVSEQMNTYLGYQAKRSTYANERHEINNNQLVYLNAAPIQSVSAVTIAGVTIAFGTNDDNYQYNPCDAKAGRLYRGVGWCGNYFTRNMTYDPVGGKRDIVVSYEAGWYFPDDVLYVKGSDTSLPYAISSACMQETISKYRRATARSEGLTSYSEGGISWGWGKSSNSQLAGLSSAGLTDDTCAVLNAYRRWGAA